MINGIDEVAITKLDVLSDFTGIKVCTGYRQNGKILKSFPTDFERLQTITPVYQTLKGWNTDISKCRSYDELPAQTKEYLEFISKQAGMKIKIVSVGPKRDQTFFMN
jgi:adenylosuccinate synthase